MDTRAQAALGEQEALSTPVQVLVTFRHTPSGLVSLGKVSTTDPGASSADQTEQRRWIETVRRKHALDEGWRVEDTQCTVNRVGVPEDAKADGTFPVRIRFAT